MERNKFQWCFNLNECVSGSFHEDIRELNADDIFIVVNRDLDNEGNQYFQLQCKRTNEIYDVPASLIEKL